MEAGDSEVQAHPWLHSEPGASLGYMRHYLKRRKLTFLPRHSISHCAQMPLCSPSWGVEPGRFYKPVKFTRLSPTGSPFLWYFLVEAETWRASELELSRPKRRGCRVFTDLALGWSRVCKMGLWSHLSGGLDNLHCVSTAFPSEEGLLNEPSFIVRKTAAGLRKYSREYIPNMLCNLKGREEGWCPLRKLFLGAGVWHFG